MKCPRCNIYTTHVTCPYCKEETLPHTLPATSMHEKGYWEEKAADERQMYREEEAEERERMFPTGE